MKPFIRAAEIWRPTPDQTMLEFGAGLFVDAPDFAAASQAMHFGRAQGLPGEAWDEGHPVLLKQIEGSHFQRTSAARAAGLTCAVALPFFVAGELSAVLVLLGGDDLACKGAIELWHNDPRVSSDMTLADGYYGGTPPAFEALTRDTFLPRGTGLPGMAWQRDEAVIMADLGESTRFLRGEVADDAGFRHGVAVPCSALGQASYVLTLLSGQDTPLTRRVERWAFDRKGERLVLSSGYCEVAGDLASTVAQMPLVDVSEALMLSVNKGVPAVLDQAAAMPGPVGASAKACASDAVAWLPVLVEDKVTELLALYL
jgi:hypothetical protein